MRDRNPRDSSPAADSVGFCRVLSGYAYRDIRNPRNRRPNRSPPRHLPHPVCRDMRNPTDALPDNPIHTPPAPPRMPRHTQRARFRTEPSSIRNIHRITHAGTYATCVIPHRTVPNPTDPPVEQVSSIPIRLILYVTAYAAAQSRCGTITNRPSGRQARPTVRGSAHTTAPQGPISTSPAPP